MVNNEKEKKIAGYCGHCEKDFYSMTKLTEHVMNLNKKDLKVFFSELKRRG